MSVCTGFTHGPLGRSISEHDRPQGNRMEPSPSTLSNKGDPIQFNWLVSGWYMTRGNYYSGMETEREISNVFRKNI